MSKFVYPILLTIVFAVPFYDFHINNQNYLSRSNGTFPNSNGIIDIEYDNYYVWVSTGAGLGRVTYNMSFEGLADNALIVNPITGEVVGSHLPVGGNPALFVNDSIVVVSGVTQEYIVATESYEPKGTGIGYSTDKGASWSSMSQPICDDCGLYEDIPWGNQELTSLAVTTEVNNVSYDIGLKDYYIYAASWAGGLRRFDYSLNNPEWEIIPLPTDTQDSLFCNLIDEDNYELNPRDPSDGGNHNHKGFSVLGTDEYSWVGTANGINRGTINGDCIDWYHQTTASGLSGNWVVGIEEQILEESNRVWAITWSAGEGQHNSISYTDNFGVNWQVVEYFKNKNIKIYNLDFEDEKIYAASEDGLYYSEDYIHWEKIETSWVDSNTGDIVLDETVYSVLTGSNSSDNFLFIGTGDGLVYKPGIDGETTVFRFWNESAEVTSENSGFSVYPNPFFINEDGILNHDGHVRFVYYNDNDEYGSIEIYDFNMEPVTTVYSPSHIGNESVIIWNGRNKLGYKVVNGTYFCKLSIKGNTYWTKLLVIN